MSDYEFFNKIALIHIFITIAILVVSFFINIDSAHFWGFAITGAISSSCASIHRRLDSIQNVNDNNESK